MDQSWVEYIAFKKGGSGLGRIYLVEEAQIRVG